MTQAPAPARAERPQFDADTVLVRFRQGVTREAGDAALAARGARRVRAVGETGFVLVVTGVEHPRRVLELLRGDARVADAELNYIRRAVAEPNDPLYRKTTRQTYLRTIRADRAWEITSGSPEVKIAVVDTGVDLDNPELESRLVAGWDFVNNDAIADDDHGHGTRVAGVAAAATNNGIGIAGVAGGSSVTPVKVLGADGSGTDANIASGITWAVDHGARVVNLSLGGPEPSDVLRSAIDYAVSRDVVVVAAAGNDASAEPMYPAAFEGAVAVTATDWSGNLASFSSYGSWVDIAAPGADLVTVVRGFPPLAYVEASGTSFAAPVVAGVAALVAAADPGATRARIVAALEHNARDFGPPGRDDQFGYGLVDAYAALTGAKAPRLVPEADAHEPNDVPDRASALPLSTPAVVLRATSAPEGDVDWYVTDVPAGVAEIAFHVAPEWLDPRPLWQWFDGALEAYGPDLRPLGRTRRQTTATGEKRLTVPTAVPGRYYLRVANTYGTRSPGDYRLWVGYGRSTLPLLTAPDDHDTGSWPEAVAIGDVTGDGRNDVLMATDSYGSSEHDYKTLLFRQDAEGWLAEPVPLRDDGAPRPRTDVAIGDLDGDGAVDAVVARSDGIDLYLQRPAGLGAPTRVPAPLGTQYVEIADMNRDGRNDLVTSGTAGITLLTNTGSGFTASSIEPQRAFDVDVGDVNGDGRLDVAAILHGSGAGRVIRLLLQATTGGFTPSDMSTVGWFDDLELADVTGDGRVDAVAGAFASVSVFPQSAAGVLGGPVVYQSESALRAVVTGDLTGDGRVDVVGVHGGGYSKLGVYVQRADGTLESEDLFDTAAQPTSPRGSAVGDVNGDGRLDVAIADSTGGFLTVMRQRSESWPRAPLWVRATSPGDGAFGISTGVTPTFRFARALDAATVNTATVKLVNGENGSAVAASVSYDATTRIVTIVPAAALAPSTAYVASVAGVRDAGGVAMASAYEFAFVTAPRSDATPPDTVISDGPHGTITGNRSPRFSFASTEPGSRFECSADGGAYFRCSSPQDYRGPGGDGPHTFAIRAIDAAGNVDPTPAVSRWSWIWGTTPPNDDFSTPTVLTGSTGSATGVSIWTGSDPREPRVAGSLGGRAIWYGWTAPASGTVAFSTSGSDFDTVLGVFTGASLDALTPVASNDDASPTDRTSLVRFRATAGTTYRIDIDGFTDWRYAGNNQTGNVSLRWELSTDTTPPETVIGSGPPASTTATWARFTFSSSEPGSTFECRLDAGVWGVCVSPKEYVGLAPGARRFEVRALDAAGNVDPSPAVWSWTIESASGSAYRDAVLADRPLAWWRLGDAAGLPAADASGNARAGSYEGGVALGAPGATADGDTAAGFDGVDDLVRVPDDAGLRLNGSFTIELWAKQAAFVNSWPGLLRKGGSWSPDGYAVFYTANGTVWFKRNGLEFGTFAGAISSTAFRHLALTFDGSTLRWYVDGVLQSSRAATLPPNAGIDPLLLGQGDQRGQHTVDEVALYATALAAERIAAHVQAARATAPPTDTTPPETTLDSHPPLTTQETSARFGFSSSETESTFDCQLDAGPWTACTSPREYTGLTGAVHTFRVRAKDAAGNVDATPAEWTWTIEAAAPPAAPAYRDAVLADAPLAYWRLGEAGGTGAADTSGNGRVGGYSGGVTLGAAGATRDGDTAAAFDGVDDRMTVPDDPALRLNGAFTIEFWARQIAIVNSWPGLLGKGGAWSANGYAVFSTSNGTLWFKRNGLEFGTFAGAITSSGVRHFALTYDGGTLRWYVDGALQTARAASLPPSAGFDGFVLGAADQPGNHVIDEVALYAAALSGERIAAHVRAAAGTPPADTEPPETRIDSGPPATTGDTSATFTFSSEPGASFECQLDSGAWGACTSPKQYEGLSVASHAFRVRARDAAGNVDPTPATHSWTIAAAPPPSASPYRDAVLADAPLAYWRLGESSGTAAADASGNGRTGSYEGGVTLGAVGALTESDTAASFDGVDDRVRVADDAAVRLNGSFTIEFFAKQAAFANAWPGLLRKGGAWSANGYAIFYTANGTVWFKRNGIEFGTFAGALSTTAYRHFALSYDGTTLRWYVDGVLQSSRTVSLPPNAGVEPLLLGQGDEPGRQMLDELALYAAALTPERIAAHHRAAAG